MVFISFLRFYLLVYTWLKSGTNALAAVNYWMLEHFSFKVNGF